MKASRLPLTLVAALACGCAAHASPPAAAPPPGLRDRRPDWISGESAEWPRAFYVLGVGMADDRPAAEDRARAEVARVFSTRVVATTSAFSAETSRSGAGVAESVSARATSDQTRSSTEKDLIGVEIVAAWHDPAGGQVYALAALDRKKAAGRLEAQLEDVDARIRQLAPAIRGADPHAAGLAALRYRALARAREPITADLRVVAPGRQVETAGVDAEAAAALARLVVVLDAKAVPDSVVTGVTRGLGAAGLTVRPGPDDASADLVVTVQSTAEDLGERDGWTWARCSGTVTVREAPSGRVLAQLSDSQREAATLGPEAAVRAARTLAARLEMRLPAELARVGEGR